MKSVFILSLMICCLGLSGLAFAIVAVDSCEKDEICNNFDMCGSNINFSVWKFYYFYTYLQSLWECKDEE